MKNRMKELAAVSDGLVAGKRVKEFGFFTNNRPDYDEKGRFIGMQREADPAGIATAVGAAGAVGAGALGHRAIQQGFGGQGVESYKQAGRYAMHNAGEAAAAARAKVKSAAGAGLDKAEGFLTRGVKGAEALGHRGVDKASGGLRRILAYARLAGRGRFFEAEVKGRLRELAVASEGLKEAAGQAKR